MFRISFLLVMSILLITSCGDPTPEKVDSSEDKLPSSGNTISDSVCILSKVADNAVWDNYNMPPTNTGPTFALFDKDRVVELLDSQYNAEIDYVLVGRDSFNMLMYAVDEKGDRIQDRVPILGKFPCPQNCNIAFKLASEKSGSEALATGKINITLPIPSKFCLNHINAALGGANVNYLGVRHKNGYKTLGIYGVNKPTSGDPIHMSSDPIRIFQSGQ